MLKKCKAGEGGQGKGEMRPGPMASQRPGEQAMRRSKARGDGGLLNNSLRAPGRRAVNVFVLNRLLKNSLCAPGWRAGSIGSQ